ncbi:MAG: aldo/keto reductase [Planctomycetota bacterium]
MKTSVLNGGLEVSSIAMGCWALAGDATWGPQDEAAAIAGVHAALDYGITLFDTAELYGAGVSEGLLGKALAGRRSQAVIASKFKPENASPAALRAACERSLQYLRTDFIDLYQIHWASREVPLVETWGELCRLRDEGKLRAIGVCNHGCQDLDDLLALGRPARIGRKTSRGLSRFSGHRCEAVVGENGTVPFECRSNQLPYNLLWRAIEFEILPRCRREGLGVLCYSPLQISLLSGKFHAPADVPAGRARSRHFAADRPQTRHGEPGCEAETFEALARLEQIAEQLGCSLPQLAIAWLLHQPGVSSVLCGIRSPEQARANAAAAEITLSPALLAELDAATLPVRDKLGPNPDMWESTSRSRYR